MEGRVQGRYFKFQGEGKESLPSNFLLNTELNKITSQSSDKGLISRYLWVWEIIKN